MVSPFPFPPLPLLFCSVFGVSRLHYCCCFLRSPPQCGGTGRFRIRSRSSFTRDKKNDTVSLFLTSFTFLFSLVGCCTPSQQRRFLFASSLSSCCCSWPFPSPDTYERWAKGVGAYICAPIYIPKRIFFLLRDPLLIPLFVSLCKRICTPHRWFVSSVPLTLSFLSFFLSLSLSLSLSLFQFFPTYVIHFAVSFPSPCHCRPPIAAHKLVLTITSFPFLLFFFSPSSCVYSFSFCFCLLFSSRPP